jgi:protein O-GlcNAc transferase
MPPKKPSVMEEREVTRLWDEAKAFFDANQIRNAARSLEKILIIDRYNRRARINLLNCYSTLNELPILLGCLRESIDVFPDEMRFRSNYLFCLNYFDATREVILSEHKRVMKEFEERLQAKIFPVRPQKNRGGKIRVGYVSGDLHEHSCSYLTLPLLQNHDRSKFEVFIYANITSPDSFTEKFKKLADHWVPIENLKDEDAAAKIYADEIDILIDLSGHTVSNRLGIFFFKPAPIQMSWYGYLNTTAVPTMDYRITDELLCPPEQEKWYTEKIVRIARSFLYEPPAYVPGVAPNPFIRQGFFTFGAFHHIKKISKPTLDLWADILRRNPDAKLMITTDRGGDTEIFLEKAFAARGIHRWQLILVKDQPIEKFFDLFAHVDLMLDTFPYTSGVTAMHAIWMGVPTLTMQAGTELFRNCAAVMRSSGYPEYIARDHVAYINQAVSLSKNPTPLINFRKTCRAKPVVDNKLVVQSLEKKIEELMR